MKFDQFYKMLENNLPTDSDLGDLENAARDFFERLHLSEEPESTIPEYSSAFGNAYTVGFNIGERQTIKNFLQISLKPSKLRTI